MARQLRIEYANAFYHIIQRGIEKKQIFRSSQDKEKFLSYIDLAHTTYTAVIHSYILMDNHFHLILETPKANLSKIMHYLNMSYAAYFNAKYKRNGPLYQGRFKAILVQADEYIHLLSRYIHLNPVRAERANSPEEYPWSSYRYFISKQEPPRWLQTDFILSIMDNNALKAKLIYKQFILDGIGREKNSITDNTHKGFVLGNKDFFESIKKKFVNVEYNPEVPLIKELKYRKEVTLEYIVEMAEKYLKNNRKLKRKLGLYLSRKYTQKTLNEIAGFYGNITDTGVTQAFTRVQKTRQTDKNLNNLLLDIEKGIDLSSVET